MPTIPQEIAESTQRLEDNASIVQQFAQGTANLYIPVENGTLRPLLYWQDWFQTELTALAQPYVDQIDASTVTATDAADSASSSADSASQSASAATTQAGNASDSADAAASSASAASGSASDAADSASAASSSATTAGDKASEASSSASDAADSATAAADSATTASTKAGEASSSATDAADSATAAAGSASTASTKAGEASSSASNAATSAGNASDSATAAAGSASTADSHRQAAASSASAAASSASSASNSASAASSSASEAEQWAQEGEDVEIVPGLYSAYHWAQKAQSAAQQDVYWDDVLEKPDLAYENADVTFGIVNASWLRPEGSAPASPNDSNEWTPGISLVEHVTDGWAPEDYMGVLHATKSINRGFQVAVGSSGIYARRLHSSLTDAPWQTLWTDANFAPANKRDVSDTSFPRYDLASTSTTSTLDLAQQQVFRVDASSSRTLSFSNAPGSSRAMTVVVHITGSSGAITWPSSIEWVGGSAPELGDNWTDVVLCWNGSIWTGGVRGSA